MEIGPISHCPHLPLPRRTRACPAASRAPAHCQRRRLERALYNRAARRKGWRSEEHTSELQSLMPLSYAVFCLQKTIQKQSQSTKTPIHHNHTQSADSNPTYDIKTQKTQT